MEISEKHVTRKKQPMFVSKMDHISNENDLVTLVTHKGITYRKNA